VSREELSSSVQAAPSPSTLEVSVGAVVEDVAGFVLGERADVST